MPAVTAPTRIKLQNILFATDFSSSARTALFYTLNLAQRYGAEVYSVHVLPHVPFVEAVQPDPEQIKLSAKQRMTELTDSESFRDIRHKELIEEGEVPEALSKLVRKYNIDLIVMSTGGRKGLGKLLLGSVAEEVFRNAECPVLTIGPHATRWEIDGKLLHVLYATDFGPESLHGLPYAISLAEENGARLTLLHVAPEPGVSLPEPEVGTLPNFDPEAVRASKLEQLRALMPKATHLEHEPEYRVEFGPPAEIIVKAAQEADLLVIGVKRPTAFTKHFGAGVAYKVACDAPCAVLSLGARYHA
jgi:nucleotide-binding universal stress UspA family protein